MEEIINQLAAARGLPASLIERSAAASAKAGGTTTEAVLRQWAEEEGLEGAATTVPSTEGRGDAEERSDDAGGPAPEVPSAGEPAPPVANGPGQAPEALLAAVAEARGMPESLVERSASARAKTAGVSLHDVLVEWAEEEGLEISASEAAPPTDGRGDAEVRGDEAGGPPPQPEVPAPAAATVTPATDEEAKSESAPAPETAEPALPFARSRYPAWLAAAIVVIPLLAVLYLVVVPNGPSCGSAGQLAVDPATGNAVGCDGSQFGVNEVSNLAVGGEIYSASCSACHGADGGGGSGPAMAGGAILDVFPEGSCDQHIEWVALGSNAWPESTYGSNGTPVAGGMPGFDGQLTELEIAQVSLYERVQFGGMDAETAEAECGFESGSDEPSADS